MQERKLYIAGEDVAGANVEEIRSPDASEVVARVHQAGPGEVSRAIEAGLRARSALASQPAGARRAVLTRIAKGIEERIEEFATTIALESGKPIKLARGEVTRAIGTFTLAASEATRMGGEIVPIDLDAGSAGYECQVRRFPVDLVVGITPFNFPLNLVAHKVAPALAVGAPIVLKPPPQAPSAALMLAALCREAGVLPGALSVLPCGAPVAERLATDPRVRVLSFTGSARVGWRLKTVSPRARVVLELGGNAAVVVCEDADLDWAAERCAFGGFSYAGQTCISVQRIYAHDSVYPDFVRRLVSKTTALPSGDPLDEKTVVGPLIDAGNAERVMSWIEEAKARGARVLCGGERRGNFVSPAVVEGVPDDARLSCEEAFGPVVVVASYRNFQQALDRVNASPYGLQAGLFTRDLRRMRAAFTQLDVGGLIVNDMPTFRSDAYPYGGMKGSGIGREGVRAAMDEYTETKVLVLSPR